MIDNVTADEKKAKPPEWAPVVRHVVGDPVGWAILRLAGGDPERAKSFRRNLTRTDIATAYAVQRHDQATR